MGLLDLEMPHGTAGETLRRMLPQPPSIVVVTMYEEPRLIRRFTGIGASAYLPTRRPEGREHLPRFRAHPYHSATRSFRSLLDDLLPRPAEEISELIVGGKPRAPGARSTPFGASQQRVKRRVGLVAPMLSIVHHGFDRLAIESLIIPEVRCPSPG